LSTADVADALELHQNTVRPHLERMREVGLLEVDADSRGAVGRPQHRYCLAPDAPSLGLEPSAFRLLARLVAGVAARSGLSPDEVAEVGRDHGRASAEGRRAGAADARAAAATSAGTSRSAGAGGGPGAGVGQGAGAGGSGMFDGLPAGAAVAGATSAGGRGNRCVAALAAELAELGFDPAVAEDAGAITIAFTHCPFRELAEAFPDIVCHLHRGIVEGFANELGGAEVTRFATLADRSPCEVDLIAG